MVDRRPNNIISIIASETILVGAHTAAFDTFISYPLTLVTRLIQIGYEPLPPSRMQILFLDDMILPNKFSYLKYIYDQFGLYGCYRGLTAEIVNSFVFYISYALYLKSNIDEIVRDNSSSTIFTLLKWDILANSVAVIISHPLYVVSIRQLAQLVGKETKYGGITSTMYTIAKEEGAIALYSGMLSRLIGDILYICGTYTCMYMFDALFDPPNETFIYIPYVIISILVNSFTYPFDVVCSCMAVNHSGLEIASPPNIPDYSNNSMRCFDDLRQYKQLFRGSSFFLRKYRPRTQKENMKSI